MLEGKKLDSGKLRMDLLPDDALMVVAQVLTEGAVKYGEYNWAKGIPASKLEAALERHLKRWKLHQTYDPESHLSHLAHVATNALMMLALELRGTPGFDDRPDVYAIDRVFRSIFERDLEASHIRSEMPPKDEEIECLR